MTDLANGSAAGDPDNLPRISRAQFWTCFGIVFAIFLFGTGPVWGRAFDIDLSVYYSYIPIPAGPYAYPCGPNGRAVFRAPENPLQLVNDGYGLRPRLAIAQLYQPIEAPSGDGRLHNIVAMVEGETAMFNVPLLPSGKRVPSSSFGDRGTWALGTSAQPIISE